MTKIYAVLAEIGPKTTFTLGLERHETLLHNLGGEKAFKFEDCAYPATKIMKRE